MKNNNSQRTQIIQSILFGYNVTKLEISNKNLTRKFFLCLRMNKCALNDPLIIEMSVENRNIN